MTFPRAAIDEAFSLLPKAMDSTLARVLHAAIGYQESKYSSRRQLLKVNGVLAPVGPAASYWQFENGRLAGINGVLTHKASSMLAYWVCDSRGVKPERMSVWEHMATDDVLGAAFARLLMYTDPYRLPGSTQEGWELYQRVWRPGKPHPETWGKSYAFALEQYS